MVREVVRTISSASGRYRVEIVRRAAGVFQVEVLRWTEEWVQGHGKVAEFWEPVKQSATFTDTLERAEALAHEDLHVYEPDDS